MNNTTKATLSLCILGAIAVVLYERNRSRTIEASLAALNQDRDSLNRQVKNLTRLVAESKPRPAETTAAVAPEAPRSPMPAPPPAVLRAEPVATPGVTIKAPKGWGKNGSKPESYVVGVDTVNSWAGQPSAYVKSLDGKIDGFGGMMQMSSPENFAGKRVRLSGWAKTEEAESGHLWFRVDGQQRGASLQFDNMDNRPIKGTSGWQEYSVVLDVPPESTALAYGFFLKGTGQMWVSGTRMEEVGPEVASTNMIKPPPPPRALSKGPVNLSFDPNP